VTFFSTAPFGSKDFVLFFVAPTEISYRSQAPVSIYRT
jgi:hypothetical protein